jgi:N-acyl-D-amino-acid deacylase
MPRRFLVSVAGLGAALGILGFVPRMAVRVVDGAPPPAVLIRGGSVLDGTGSAARLLDVRVSAGVITEVAASLAPRPGERVIDATGLTVSPGFIDLHSHANRGMERLPGAESHVRQGITTAVVGQDGGSSVPVSEFFETVSRVRPAINYATTIGHGTVRSIVMGGDYRRAATAAEIETMRNIVDRGMRDGAVGLSSGTEYDPGFYAEPRELEALAAAVAPYGGFYASHVRDEEDDVVEAWREVIEVGRKTGARVHISHAKLASRSVWGRAGEALAEVDRAVKEGVDVTLDWYPYTYWQSSMYVLISDRDFENRARWEMGLQRIGGAQNVLVTNYRPDSSLNGRTLAEIARLRGKDPETTAIEMMREAGPGTGVITTAMQEEDLEKILGHPRTMICSDGGLEGAHPRGYGAFPRVLGVYARERGTISLSEAIAKMTSRSAKLLGFDDRGTIAVGKKADIVVFDPETVADRATKEKPAQFSVGILYLIVNGEVVLDNGNMTGARPGLPLRREGWRPYRPAGEES